MDTGVGVSVPFFGVCCCLQILGKLSGWCGLAGRHVSQSLPHVVTWGPEWRVFLSTGN